MRGYGITGQAGSFHTEKMLEVQAAMAKAYATAYALTKKEAYRDSAAGIVRYVHATLPGPHNW